MNGSRTPCLFFLKGSESPLFVKSRVQREVLNGSVWNDVLKYWKCFPECEMLSGRMFCCVRLVTWVQSLESTVEGENWLPPLPWDLHKHLKACAHAWTNKQANEIRIIFFVLLVFAFRYLFCTDRCTGIAQRLVVSFVTFFSEGYECFL